MSDYGFIWTDGTDISEAELKNIIVSSSHPCLKFAFSGTGSITYTHDLGGEDELIVAHNLKYEPLFIVFTQWFNINTGLKVTSYRKAPFFDSLLDGSMNFSSEPYVNSTQLRYKVSSWTGSGIESITLKYLYFIYYDPDEDI